MTSKQNSLITSVRRLIENNNIADAIALLSDFLKENKLYNLKEDLDQLSSSYKYMLQFALTGNDDPGRVSMINNVKADIDGILDEIHTLIDCNDSPKLFYAIRRLDKLQNISLEKQLNDTISSSASFSFALNNDIFPTEEAKKLEDAIDNLFEKILSLPFKSVKELKDLYKFCLEEVNNDDIKLMIISALLISSTQQYDRYKLLTLIDIYDNTNNDQIAARCLVSIIVIFNLYSERIKADAEIANRLILWQDSLINYTRLRDAIMAFLKTTDTTRINDKMKNDLMPKLNQINPEVLKKISEKNGEIDLESFEGNPEWDEMMKKSGLEDRLKEFSELQSEGADVMMLPFSQLKTFPFFNKLSHWFLPFNYNHSLLNVLRELGGDMLSDIIANMPFCDSDKYSFALSLNQMPRHNIDMIKLQLSSATEQMKIERNEKNLHNSNPEFDKELINYLRNLYRFFNLFRFKDQFKNPMQEPIHFISLPFLGEMLREEELIKLAAEFFFKRGYYEHSLELFLLLAEQQPDEHLWDKIAFCHQSLGNAHEALNSYRNAEMFNVDNLWRQKMMALCFRALGDYANAAEYYDKMLVNDENNVKLIYNSINCHMQNANYNRVINLCYKYDYIKPGDAKIKQILALALIYSGDVDKGKSIAEQLILEHSIVDDPENYFILGTLNLSIGKLNEALKFYRSIKDKNGSTWDDYVERKMKSLGIWKINADKVNLLREYNKML